MSISPLQIYKQNVDSVISEFVGLVMTTITLQPTLSARFESKFIREEVFCNYFIILSFTFAVSKMIYFHVSLDAENLSDSASIIFGSVRLL